MATDVAMAQPMDLGKASAVPDVDAQADLYVKLKTLQRQLEFIEIQVTVLSATQFLHRSTRSCCSHASSSRRPDRTASQHADKSLCGICLTCRHERRNAHTCANDGVLQAAPASVSAHAPSLSRAMPCSVLRSESCTGLPSGRGRLPVCVNRTCCVGWLAVGQATGPHPVAPPALFEELLAPDQP